MSHPIVDRIRAVKRRARLLAIARAICLVLAVMVATALMLALLDALTQIEDRGTRILLSAGWLFAVIVAMLRWMVPVARASWSDQAVARLVERRFPQLRGRLSSSLDFLARNEEDASLGSRPLVRNVIAETATELETLDLSKALDYRPPTKALMWLAGIGAVVFGIASLAPSCGPLAAQRLLMPWRANPWPRVNHLSFVDPPLRVGRGSDLRLELIDKNGRMPSEVFAQIRLERPEEGGIDVIAMQRQGESMVLQRNNISHSFQYRAIGGDDRQMAWRRIEVVEPPRIVSAEIRTTPPEYTGWLPSKISGRLAGLRVLGGTRIDFSVSADRPLREATLRVDNPEGRDQFTSSLAGEASFILPAAGDSWLAKQSGSYQISMVDQAGTKTVEKDAWNVRVIADTPPVLTLQQPPAEELVTPAAVVRIEYLAEDDLAVQQVRLQYLRADRSEDGQQEKVIWQGVDRLPSTAAPVQLPPEPDVHVLTYDWSLESLGLRPGAVLSYSLVASDYRPATGQTLPRRLLVVSRTDLLDRAGRRQAVVLSRLQQRLSQQRRAQSLLKGVKVEVDEAEAASKASMDRLQAAVMLQRQVNSALAAGDSEVLAELDRLLAMLRRSGAEHSEVGGRVAKTTAALRELAETHLKPALQAGSQAQQSLQASQDQGDSEVPGEAKALMETALTHQQQATGALEGLLEGMLSWDSYRRFAQELNELLQQQRDVAEATQKLTPKVLVDDPAELDATSRAALRTASTRQKELARRMDRVLSNLAKSKAKLTTSEPQSAERVGDALDVAWENAVSGAMRQAGKELDQSRPGLATQRQEAAQRGMEQMLDQLMGNIPSHDERLAGLRTAERQLHELHRQQSQLSDEYSDARRTRDTDERRRALQRLVRRQQQAAQQAQRLGRQLRRVQAGSSSEQTGQAAQAGNAAAESAGKGQAQAALQESRLSESKLDAARQGLREQIEEAASKLAQEQVIQLAQQLEALISQQQHMAEEIARLHGLAVASRKLSAAQQASLAISAETQRAVAQDVALVAAQVTQLPSFVFALEIVHDQMQTVAQYLEQEATGPSTQQRGAGSA